MRIFSIIFILILITACTNDNKKPISETPDKDSCSMYIDSIEIIQYLFVNLERPVIEDFNCDYYYPAKIFNEEFLLNKKLLKSTIDSVPKGYYLISKTQYLSMIMYYLNEPNLYLSNDSVAFRFVIMPTWDYNRVYRIEYNLENAFLICHIYKRHVDNGEDPYKYLIKKLLKKDEIETIDSLVNLFYIDSSFYYNRYDILDGTLFILETIENSSYIVAVLYNPDNINLYNLAKYLDSISRPVYSYE